MKCFSIRLAPLVHIVGGVSLFIVLFMSLMGCATSLPKITLLKPSPPDPLNRFLQYFHHAKSLDPQGLHQLHIQEEEVFFYQNDRESVVHLALLSLLQEPKFKTISRSIDLLKIYLYENSADDDVHHFMAFLHHILSQAQYRAHRYDTTKEQLKAALIAKAHQAERYKRTKRHLDHLGAEKRKQTMQHKKAKRALRKERLIAENLRQQIEQLKTIEKTLNKRKQERSPST